MKTKITSLLVVLVLAGIVNGCAQPPFLSGNYQGTCTLEGYDGDVWFFNLHQDTFGQIGGNIDLNWNQFECDGTVVSSFASGGVGNINTNLQCDGLLSRFYCTPVTLTDDTSDGIADYVQSSWCTLDIHGHGGFDGNFYAEN